ncbi:Rrf2 family transcriptional regulator [bacterium]|nr:Rrf2 family transcriptional regulator [bacterium]
MFKISEASAIALHSIIYINNKDETSSLKEIAGEFNISANHLSKVLQRFVKEGVLISVKGPSGGFKINQKYKDMTFMEVYEIFEGKYRSHNCLFNNGHGNCTKCIMSDLISGIEKEFTDYMTNTKISDFKS